MHEAQLTKKDTFNLAFKEETDNAPTDKTEQLTLGMKQSLSFQIL